MATQPHVDKPFDPRHSPWPEIRKARIQKLLPQAMQLAGIDSWLVACRENNNDPLALHVGGGVRDMSELGDLNAMGVAGALVATALHRGTITLQHIAALNRSVMPNSKPLGLW